MKLAKNLICGGMATYFSLMFGCLVITLIKMDFTGYPIGKAGLLTAMGASAVMTVRMANLVRG